MSNNGLIIYRKVFYVVILKKKISFIECGKLFYLTMKLMVIVEILQRFITNLLIFGFFILGTQAKRAGTYKITYTLDREHSHKLGEDTCTSMKGTLAHLMSLNATTSIIKCNPR